MLAVELLARCLQHSVDGLVRYAQLLCYLHQQMLSAVSPQGLTLLVA